MPKTNAEIQKEWRERMKSSGYVRSTFWIKPEHKKQIKEFIDSIIGDDDER